MNLGLAAATFALVVPAELPDKTFISAVVLSTRHRALPVWIGTASALVVQAGVAVLAGRLLDLAPRRAVAGVVGALFLAGAAYLLFAKEEVEVGEGAALAAEEEHLAVPEAAPLPAPDPTLRIVGASFIVVALAEFGDLTQVLIANLGARFRDPLSVFLGASVGFLFISAIGVTLGRTLTRFVPLSLVRKVSAGALCGLGIWSLVTAFTS